jgi:hypothetical protein
MMQAGSVAPFPHLVSKTIDRERLALPHGTRRALRQ